MKNFQNKDLEIGSNKKQQTLVDNLQNISVPRKKSPPKNEKKSSGGKKIYLSFLLYITRLCGRLTIIKFF